MSSDNLQALMERIAASLEEAPGHPFSQAEIDELRAAVTTYRLVLSRLNTLGWVGRIALYLLGTAVVVLSQWDSLMQRLGR